MGSTGDQVIFALKTEDKNRNNSRMINKPEKLETTENYFRDVTLEFLQEKFRDDVVFDKLLFVSFNNQHLRTLGVLSELVTNLQVCNLSGNFLSDISSLMLCPNLQKLDVHGNQITDLPDHLKWSNMQNLEFLYLHDNAFASFGVVKSISGCPKLVALTLYDTPLSLWIAYRHSVVNSLHSLKALDQFVVADEEIINDLNQSHRFAAFRKELKVDLCPQQTQLHSDATEFEEIKNLKRKINKIMAHHSPVIIIQKCIRGFLSRCRSAADMLKHEANHLELTHPLELTSSTIYSVLLPHKEVKHQREGQKLLHPKSELMPVPISIPSSNNIPSSISISCTSIEQDYLKVAPCEDSCSSYENIDETGKKQDKNKNVAILPNKRDKKLNKPKKLKWQTLREKSEDYFAFSFIGEDIPISTLHLQGYSKPIHQVYAFTNMMMENQLVSSAIRSAHDSYHRIPNVPKLEPMKIPVEVFLSQRKQMRKENMYKRLFKHINKSCLFAVQRAYEDQWQADKNKIKLDTVYQRKIEEKQRRQNFEERERQKYFQKLGKIEQEKLLLNGVIEKKAVENKKQMEVLQMKRFDSSKITFEREAERKFTKDFSCQQLSLSRSLLRHNYGKSASKGNQSETYVVKSIHLSEEEQLKKIQNYIINSQKRKQVENNIAKCETIGSQHFVKLNNPEESKNPMEHMEASHLKGRVGVYPFSIVSLNKLNKLKIKKTSKMKNGNSNLENHIDRSLLGNR
ncbi:leucine-rich repeat and IQ domain-containing protein 3 [Octopus bimaculoides]|uniref:Leucine-rich repeat and IQ domain-containing protein 3 n=1 Tax=Octopus bimaculoides TaxID=37653 RepID=A0A0L8GWN8_OCTBM|nr:leucine-rich repeat and IQ domain-containing protein 3 [Octopus bimaculoides]|eukprot:XP_014777671.1 PREDICTED: leucine-rich repeat and IQ domain-containing protein 3-like [Octopus bimaculoides]